MNVKDRTGEFKATVESVYNRGITVGMTGASGVEPLLGRSVGSPRHEHSEFTRRATEINGGIQRVLGKLEKLTKCTRLDHPILVFTHLPSSLSSGSK